jgi:hypothetical protein
MFPQIAQINADQIISAKIIEISGKYDLMKFCPDKVDKLFTCIQFLKKYTCKG